MTLDNISERAEKTLLVDAGFVVAISVLLAIIHFLTSPSLKLALAFDHQKFEFWTLLTSAYVHAGPEHLINNVMGFLVAAVMALNFCRYLDERSWFYATSLALLLVLPILVNLTSYAIIGVVAPEASPIGRGFSGVGAGFLGFVLAVFLVWTAKRSSWAITQYVGYGIVLLLLLEIAVIYSGIRLDLLGVTVAGLVATGWGFSREVNLEEIHQNLREWLPEFGLSIVMLGFLGLFILLLFPTDIANGDMTVNIFAHAAGLVYGAALALVIWSGVKSPHPLGLMT